MPGRTYYTCVTCFVLQVGGFKLPFIVVGSAIFLVGFASMFVLPPQNGTLLITSVTMYAYAAILQTQNRQWVTQNEMTHDPCEIVSDPWPIYESCRL